MNEWALVRMRQTQVYQQGHHAAGHMTGHGRCSALIQTKDLGKHCFSLYFWFCNSKKLLDFFVESHILLCLFMDTLETTVQIYWDFCETADGYAFKWSASCFCFLQLLKKELLAEYW